MSKRRKQKDLKKASRTKDKPLKVSSKSKFEVEGWIVEDLGPVEDPERLIKDLLKMQEAMNQHMIGLKKKVDL